MAIIRITDLHLRTIIGANAWERNVKQDVVINVTVEFDPHKAILSDDIKDTVDYKIITKEIIKEVENSSFHLLEKLASMVLEIVMAQKGVNGATVKVDKPEALRFAKSVSVELSKSV